MAYKKRKKTMRINKYRSLKKELQFQDPDEQHWLEIGKLELEKENIYYP